MPKEIIEMPDGQGGMIKTEAERFSDGAKADIERQQKTLNEESVKAKMERVADCAEALNSYLKAYATDHTLDLDEMAAAMHLDQLNWREYWPEDHGGPEAFDLICDETYRWFEENKDK